MSFGSTTWRPWILEEAESRPLIKRALEHGINFFDTADVYSVWVPGHKGGESETIIGNWLKRSGARGRVVIATKVGIEIAPGETDQQRAHAGREVGQARG